MKRPDEQTVSVSLLALTSGISLFTSLLPDLAEVRKSTRDSDVRNDVRMGEAAAVALTIAIGLTASSMVGSPAPAMLAVITAAVLVLMYESVLSTNPRKEL